MERQPYPEGVDCVWLASDRDGCLGVFITAGVGPIPLKVLDSGRVPIEDMEARLRQLPPVSEVQLLVSVKRPDDFIELAERGMFVYDWTDIGRTAREARHVYEPVAVPSKPITASSLPGDLAVLVEELRLKTVVFAAGNAVDVRAYMTCIDAE